MDYAKSLTFVFDDPRWVTKIAIGTGLVLVSSLLSVIIVGILGFLILGGYSIRLLQNVRDGEEFPLPEWDDWGGDFMRGLKFAIVGLVWALPLILFVIPAAIGGAITEGNGPAQFVGGMILIGGICLSILYGLFVAAAAPGFSIAFATDERISSGLAFTDIWHWTWAHIGDVIIAVLVILLVQFLISLVGSIAGAILCLIGMIVTIPLASLAVYIYSYHVYGQLAYNFPFGGLGGAHPIVPAAPDTLATGVTTETATTDTEAGEGDESEAQDAT